MIVACGGVEDKGGLEARHACLRQQEGTFSCCCGHELPLRARAHNVQLPRVDAEIAHQRPTLGG